MARFGEALAGVRACEQQRQALRRGDQRRRQRRAGACVRATRRVAGADADGPVQAERFERRRRSAPGGVGGERAHRREPQHASAGAARARRARAAKACSAAPGHSRVGLAGAGGRVDEAAAAGGASAPTPRAGTANGVQPRVGEPRARARPRIECGRRRAHRARSVGARRERAQGFERSASAAGLSRRASAACAGSAPRCRTCGAASAGCPRSRSRTPARASTLRTGPNFSTRVARG